MSAIGAPVGVITMFIILLFTVGNRFIKSFLSVTQNERTKHKVFIYSQEVS